MARCFWAVLTVVFVFAAFPVHAGERQFDCSIYGTAMSRSLFGNTGTFATDGPVLLNVTECAHGRTGLYGEVFLSAPLQNFGNGKEIDLRLGRRSRLLGLDLDLSLAWYHFGVGDAGDFNTLNFKARAGRGFAINSSAKLELYGIGDYQRSLTLATDSFAGALGAALAVDLPVPGTPNLRLGAEGWKYLTAPMPGWGPIGSFTADLGFPIPGTKAVVGPRAQVTLGGVDEPHSSTVRSMYGAFIFVPFGF